MVSLGGHLKCSFGLFVKQGCALVVPLCFDFIKTPGGVWFTIVCGWCVTRDPRRGHHMCLWAVLSFILLFCARGAPFSMCAGIFLWMALHHHSCWQAQVICICIGAERFGMDSSLEQAEATAVNAVEKFEVWLEPQLTCLVLLHETSHVLERFGVAAWNSRIKFSLIIGWFGSWTRHV